jgi:SAM-dependent methyltransferase
MGGVMDQTPIHDSHNPDLLKLIPADSKKVIEIGCSSGALAREFKKLNKMVDWVGVEIDASYAELAKRYCDKTLVENVDDCDLSFFKQFSDRDCWVFGDTLEHFKDPWSVLKNIRGIIPEEGSVAACIPNAQHWSLVVRMALGDFRYEDCGLLDRTHLRWFSRQTMIDLFETSGFRIVEGLPRIFDEPNRDKFLPLIAEIAKTCGVQPEKVINDSIPLQYVVRAIPV